MQQAARRSSTGQSTVGVIGLGAVGSAVYHGMSAHYPCIGYDIDDDHDWADILRTDIAMVCVPTPEAEDGRLDCSAVVDVLQRLVRDGYERPVVVKSTVRVGFMDEAAASFPHLRLVYMPEFLRERSRFTWFLNPDRLLLSGRTEDVDEVLSYFSWAKGATVIRTNHASAELGKLAHNGYIATKVTFTNEIEQIAKEVGADTAIVMAVVSADRRVRSDGHLRPGFGPYGGKCVPKDTAELTAVARPEARLLRAVRASRAKRTETSGASGESSVVIIPTKNRPEKFDRALASVAHQVRRPSQVFVVSDCDPSHEEETRRTVAKFLGQVPVELIRNRRTSNLSGALNTGLERVQELSPSPNMVFVAFLDDDDWWGRHYLDNVATYAQETGADWIVSGLVRRAEGSRPVRQEIPSGLAVRDFLVTNPNVQGSNLFVRLSRLLEVGGFDEALPSTTDRDICIRLLRLPGIRYEILRNYLVHHDASSDPTRLSAPGSPQKRAGLEAFYRKYASSMTPEQRALFLQRARDVFQVEIQVEV